MKLYLIRHGKTKANENHLYCGSTDLPLSDLGIQELSEYQYQIPKSCHYITSGMMRTEQTLQYLFGDVAHTQDDRFREVNFGIFEMKSYEELKMDEDYQNWITGDNEKNVPPKGESGQHMTERVLDGLNQLIQEDQDTVLITHGGVIACIMNHLFPKEEKNRYEWQLKPGRGYVITEGAYRLL